MFEFAALYLGLTALCVLFFVIGFLSGPIDAD